MADRTFSMVETSIENMCEKSMQHGQKTEFLHSYISTNSEMNEMNEKHETNEPSASDWDKLLNDIENATLDPTIEKSIVNTPNTWKNDDEHLDFQTNNRSICQTCQTAYFLRNNILYCPKCGEEQEIIHDSDTPVNNGYALDMAYIPFRIIGKNSYWFQKSLLRCCADYSVYRDNVKRKEIVDQINQYKYGKMPKNVVNEAISLYKSIRDHGCIYRGNGKKGIIGACLFYACIIKNLSKTHREIASILEVDEKYVLQGDRILQELNEKNIVQIPTLLMPLEDYLDQYLPALGIDKKYAGFVTDLIKRAEKMNLHIQMESRMTTKCVGAIYMLVERVKELKKRISRDVIAQECKLSKTTFMKYFYMLNENFMYIKPVFKKHGIPMPVEWRCADLVRYSSLENQ